MKVVVTTSASKDATERLLFIIIDSNSITSGSARWLPAQQRGSRSRQGLASSRRWRNQPPFKEIVSSRCFNTARCHCVRRRFVRHQPCARCRLGADVLGRCQGERWRDATLSYSLKRKGKSCWSMSEGFGTCLANDYFWHKAVGGSQVRALVRPPSSLRKPHVSDKAPNRAFPRGFPRRKSAG